MVLKSYMLLYFTVDLFKEHSKHCLKMFSMKMYEKRPILFDLTELLCMFDLQNGRAHGRRTGMDATRLRELA